MLALLASCPQALGLASLLICVALALGVIVYVLTDGRRSHHGRMSAMALDDHARDQGARHE
jgi:hypothetical protein